MNNICTTVVSFRAWSSGLLHVLVFRVRRSDSRRIQKNTKQTCKDDARWRTGSGSASGQGTYEKALKTGFSEGVTHVSYRPLHILVQLHILLSLLLVLFGGGSAPLYSSSASFSADGLHRPLPTCPFRRMVCRGVTHVSYRPLHILLSLLQGLHRSTPRRMVCKGHYLLVLFGGWSAELPYLSFSVRRLQFRALLLVLPSRQARHMVCTYISPTSFCPFRRMVCTYSPMCPLLPVVHPQPIVSRGQHCVHHSSCPIGPSPWWRCTLHSITIMKVIILPPKEFRPPSLCGHSIV